MLEVDFGEGNVGFVPLPEHVQVEVQREAQTLVVDLPDGLLDVYTSSEDSDELEDNDLSFGELDTP